MEHLRRGVRWLCTPLSVHIISAATEDDIYTTRSQEAAQDGLAFPGTCLLLAQVLLRIKDRNMCTSHQLSVQHTRAHERLQTHIGQHTQTHTGEHTNTHARTRTHARTDAAGVQPFPKSVIYNKSGDWTAIFCENWK